MRSLLALTLFAFATAACTDAPVDELAGESALDAAGDGGKADASTDGTYTYFAIHRDQRKCAAPACGGYFVNRAGRATTTCADHNTAAACYVYDLDLTQAGLSPAQQTQLQDAADHVIAGTETLLRGRLVRGGNGLGHFVVTEGWIAASAPAVDGVFVKVRDSGARCIQAPCANKTERVLNGSRTADLAELGWEDLGASDDVLSELITSTFHEGVIVVGSRYTVSGPGGSAKARTVTAAFRRLMP
jgi:hypothetical protein